MPILKTLKASLERPAGLKLNRFGDYTPYDLKVIVALFVLGAAHADGKVTDEERVEMNTLLSHGFDFSEEEARQIIDVAEFLLDKSHSIEKFATEIQEAFTEHQRVYLLAMYIRIIEADGVVTKEETNGIKKLLEHLGLDKESIGRAREELVP